MTEWKPSPGDVVASADDEVRFATAVLDLFGAPKTVYNPYNHCEDELNLAGRIHHLIDPENTGVASRCSAERLAALERVAEAARRAFDPGNDNWYLSELSEALAALDALNE